MKPTAGIIELDIPLDPTESYNPKTGRKWGAAAELIKDEGKIDAFGLAGGYTTSFPTRPRPRRPASARHSSTRAQSSTRTNETSDHDMDAALSSSSSSESEAKPEPELKKISLAGKLEAPDDTSVQYMAGVFRAARFTGSNDELHLNPIHSIVQLVPQLYHVDALDAANALSAQSAAQRTKSQAEQKPSQQQQKQQNASSAPQAVQMTAKILSNEGYDMQEVQKWLRAAQEEPWRRTAFYDEETLEAWHRYTKLFLDDDDDDDDKEGSSSSGGGDGSGAVRRGRPELRSTMSDRQWLYSICPKKPADYAEVFADLVTQKKDREGEEGGGGGGLRKAGVLKVGSGSSTVSPATAKGKGKAKA